MKETAYILQNATSKSLVIMDEIGRGTSTTDGISIALAVIKHLSSENQSLVLFATHFHELADLIIKEKVPSISFHQALVSSTDESFSCLYKIVKGVMTASHGIEVAKLAGLPSTVIKNAHEIRKTL